MADLLTIDTLPRTSAEAIRVYDERYLAGISAAQPPDWPEQFGDVDDTDSPHVVYPLSMLSVKYQKTQGESRFKRMVERDPFDLKVVEYDAGAEAPLMDLFTKVFAYRKWNETPARMILAEKRHVNRNIVTLLEDGAQITKWDNLAFFHAAHLANPSEPNLGTWGNLQAVAKDPTDLAALEAEATAGRKVLDEQGEKYGVEFDTVLLPTDQYERVYNKYVVQQLIANPAGTASVSNPYVGRFKLVHVPELVDANDWYLVDSKILRAQGIPPWGALKFRAPDSLGLRWFDESSDFFKNTGNIKVSSHIWMAFTLLFPHAIRRVTGAIT